MQDDVFTVCRDRGASAALLYSTTAETCSINTAYLGFSDRPLNVYVTTSLTGSKMIEGQFVWVELPLLSNPFLLSSTQGCNLSRKEAMC